MSQQARYNDLAIERPNGEFSSWGYLLNQFA
jgi:hypothetical protein